MNDLPMHPIPECLRLFQINRDGPATVSCAEGVRCSSPAQQRGALPPSIVQVSFGFNPVVLVVDQLLPVFPRKRTSSRPVGMSQECHKLAHTPQQTRCKGCNDFREQHAHLKAEGGVEVDHQLVFQRATAYRLTGGVRPVTCYATPPRSPLRKPRNGAGAAKLRGCDRLRPAHPAPRLHRRLQRRAARPVRGKTSCH